MAANEAKGVSDDGGRHARRMSAIAKPVIDALANAAEPKPDDMKKLIEVQRVVEDDENMGVPEAQATLEVLHFFN